MSAFIWTIVIFAAIEVVTRIICLAVGYLPERTVAATVLDTLIGIGFVIWGLVILL
jgi:hypothetical protein